MALRQKRQNAKLDRKVKVENTQFFPYFRKFLETRLILGYSEETNRRYDSNIRRFIRWCVAREVVTPQNVTRQVLEGYQRYLYYQRKTDGTPISIGAQTVYLTSIRAFFKWLSQDRHIPFNPASELILPKRPKALPRAILTIDDMKKLLSQPDISTPDGIRDRTMLEVFYSCGIRRKELVSLEYRDIDVNRQTLFVREGKGKKDRYLPIGDSANQWLKKYLTGTRDELVNTMAENTLFLSDYGEPFVDNQLGHRVKKYLEMAGMHVNGSCHLLRHAMATHMLENGADIRFIQVMLGHEDLSSTEIYTRVSVEKLREVHRATHPMRLDK